MKIETKSNLAYLYYMHTKPRRDLGLPNSLADHLSWIRQDVTDRLAGKRVHPLDSLSDWGIPLEYYQALKDAVAEGVSDKELEELTFIRVPAREAGVVTKFFMAVPREDVF